MKIENCVRLINILLIISAKCCSSARYYRPKIGRQHLKSDNYNYEESSYANYDMKPSQPVVSSSFTYGPLRDCYMGNNCNFNDIAEAKNLFAILSLLAAYLSRYLYGTVRTSSLCTTTTTETFTSTISPTTILKTTETSTQTNTRTLTVFSTTTEFVTETATVTTVTTTTAPISVLTLNIPTLVVLTQTSIVCAKTNPNARSATVEVQH